MGHDQDDPYLHLCVHGTLPLCIDEASGRLRFARIGADHPSSCISSADGLPDAEIDLFAFRDSLTMLAWTEGVRETAGNAVDVVQAEAKWARFSLLVRHDRPRREGATLDEAIGFRSLPAVGASAQEAAKQAKELRKREGRAFAELAAAARVEREWAAEIGLLTSTEVLDYDRSATVTARTLCAGARWGGIKGLGPTVRFARDGGGYVAAWPVDTLMTWRATEDRMDAAAAELGFTRHGRVMAMRLGSFDVAELARLRDGMLAVKDAVRNPPVPDGTSGMKI